jgi:hypothetical protein
MVRAISGVLDTVAVTEAVQKINAINLKTLTRLADLQFDMAGLGLTGTAEQASVLAAVENYRDLYSIEARLASEYGGRLMQISQETTGLLLACHGEYVAAMEGIYTVARENISDTPAIKTPVKKAPAKPAAKRKPARKH